MRNNHEGGNLIEMILRHGNRILPLTQTLGATYVMDADMPQLQFLDPGGAGREINLPPVADSKGLFFIIVNTADAAENLTVEDSASAALTPAAVVGQNEIGLFFCDGVRWQGFTGVA